MKIPRLMARPTIGVASVFAALGLTSLASICGRAAAPDSPSEAARTTVAISLQWNFEVGDMFRIREKVVTLSTDSSGNRYRNEAKLVYAWRVTHVAQDGTATLVITPESAKTDCQLPLAGLDANEFEAQAWTQAEFSCRVTNAGQVIDISGAVPTAWRLRPMSFTPGDFGQLPGTIVQSGDAWDAMYNQTAETDGSFPVRAQYRLVDCWCETDLPGLHIEGFIRPATRSGRQRQQAEFGPMICVSHFDPIGGYFVDQITVTSGQLGIGPDEIVTFKLSTKRQVAKAPYDGVAGRDRPTRYR